MHKLEDQSLIPHNSREKLEVVRAHRPSILGVKWEAEDSQRVSRLPRVHSTATGARDKADVDNSQACVSSDFHTHRDTHVHTRAHNQ